jgi:thiol-disulfide isomerase/thioredoxin
MSARAAFTALAAVILGGVTGYLGYRWYTGSQGPGLVPAGGAPSAAAELSLADEPAAQLKVPDALPDIHLAGLDGRVRALKDFGHRPLIVNFWATWCEPCRREMPLLTALRQEHQAEALEVVGIAVDFRDSVTEFLKTSPLPYPLLIGEEDGIEAAKAFGMQLVLPFSVFVDEQDRIVAVKIGELHRDEADAILGAMRELRSGRITIAAARSSITAQLKQLGMRRHMSRSSAS